MEKKHFTAARTEPTDEVEYLIRYYQGLATQLNFSVTDEAVDILTSLEFDAARLDTSLVYPQAELDEHYYLLDIRGTVRGALKLVGENPDSFTRLAALSQAVRIYFNLRDWHDDIAHGLVNISAEDCARYHIDPSTLGDATSPELQRWFKDQAREGLKLLRAHRWAMQGKPFKPFTRLVLWLVYERGAQAYLSQVGS